MYSDESLSFIARNGVGRPIPVPTVSAINSRNEVLGEVFDFETFKRQSVIWNSGVVSKVRINGFDLNNKGQVVGTLDGVGFEAALWMDGVAYILRSLIETIELTTSCVDEPILFVAFAINDKGQIVVDGGCSTADAEFKDIGVLLTPIP
jgi:hypothetical protein